MAISTALMMVVILIGLIVVAMAITGLQTLKRDDDQFFDERGK